MKKKALTITIGIPTYYGAPSIVKTVKSILNSKTSQNFTLIVTVDGNPLNSKIKTTLKKLGVVVWDNRNRLGQLGRIKELVKKTSTDVLILTQDDILFSPTTIDEIVKVFSSKPELTMAGCNVLPVKAATFFENIVEMGVSLTHRIGKRWNRGDNYLLASGRCLAFKTSHAKKFVIDENIINSDAYLYFLNKLNKGIFTFIESAIVYNKSPENLNEHIKQSKKFQISKNEVSKYIPIELSPEYSMPTSIVFTAIVEEFLHKPIELVCYLCITLFMRFSGNAMYKNATRFWSTDISTKRI
jgi:cellulose synthase/poly-beta-1,6-N-acetylglucosamine synthase-like glycosyltransferase